MLQRPLPRPRTAPVPALLDSPCPTLHTHTHTRSYAPLRQVAVNYAASAGAAEEVAAAIAAAGGEAMVVSMWREALAHADQQPKRATRTPLPTSYAPAARSMCGGV
jgi:hypothetical protein